MSRILFTGGGVPGQVPPGAGTPPGSGTRQDQVHPWVGTPPGRYTPQAGTPPGPGTPQAGTPPRQVYPPWDQVHPPDQVHPQAVHAGRYGQQVGGTHPTGMQFLSLNVFTELGVECYHKKVKANQILHFSVLILIMHF